MPPVTIVKVPTTGPADTHALAVLANHGFSQEDVIGIVGKTEGNGGINDHSRLLSSHVWDEILPRAAISIFSGGTEGVLSPHVCFFLASKEPTGLVATGFKTWNIPSELIGSVAHVECVAATVCKMLETARIRSHDVQLVLVKCPLLTAEKIAAARAAGQGIIAADSHDSMARSRYASALGVGVALGEVAQNDLATFLSDGNFHTAKVSCSSGAEIDGCHILVLANDPSMGMALPSDSSSPLLRSFAGVMKSAIDFDSVKTILEQALTPTAPYTKATLLQMFVKAEADPSGYTVGRFRHTMLTDSDLDGLRHARAAVGGLIAGVTGDCHIYVSGGAEGQGPPGGGGVCVLAKWEI